MTGAIQGLEFCKLLEASFLECISHCHRISDTFFLKRAFFT